MWRYRILTVGWVALLAACGGGGDTDALMAETSTGSKTAHNRTLVLDAPVALPGTHRVRLKWRHMPPGGRHEGEALSLWLADDTQDFHSIATGLSGDTTDVDVGALWKIDWPSARLRLRWCAVDAPCIDSNAQALVEALVASTITLRPQEQRLASVFSSRVALSADGHTLAVADPLDMSQAEPRPPGIGSIQVFRRCAKGCWRRETTLSNFHVEGNFGDPMALSGDGRTLVVGAYTDGGLVGGVNPPAAGGGDRWTGAVYVFVREAGASWRQQAFLKAAEPVPYETFGYRLAVDASGARIAVGGTQHRIHVFARDSSGTWRQDGLIEEPVSDAQLQSNQALAVSGNGLVIASTAVIAGPETRPRTRAVLVYSRNSTGQWTHQADLRSGKPPPSDVPFDPQPDDFGNALALDHRGTTLAVGAPGDAGDASDTEADPANRGAPHAGAVYLFGPSDGNVWQRLAFVKARSAARNDQFGAEVALSGDGQMLLGKACGQSGNAAGVRRNHRAGTTIGQQDGANDSECFWGGSAYVITRNEAGQWAHTTSVVPVGAELVAYGFFSIALSADASTVALGTSTYDPDGGQENRVFVY